MQNIKKAADLQPINDFSLESVHPQLHAAAIAKPG